jgi:hypothetical protein
VIGRVDPGVARNVAAAYAEMPASARDPRVAAAYARLVGESDQLFRQPISPNRPDRVRPPVASAIGDRCSQPGEPSPAPTKEGPS